MIKQADLMKDNDKKKRVISLISGRRQNALQEMLGV
jgi:hypothetical protein